MKKNLDEIENRLLNKTKNKFKNDNTDFKRIGLRVPDVRLELKTDYSFSDKTTDEIIEIWDYVWKNSTYFEVMSLALYYYQWKTLTKKEFNKIKIWVNRCSCWEHSDDLSKIYARVLEDSPEMVLPVLRKWNISENPWKRRQSLVGLLEYACKRKKVQSFETLISFVKPLLKDEEYYVQKGLGWTLREIYNKYPDETIEFLKTNLHEINSIAYSAATEKIPKDLKKDFNLIRKERRKELTTKNTKGKIKN